MEVDKPWGRYIDIYREDQVVFKKLGGSPGAMTSYQTHAKRGEFWYAVKGEGVMKYNSTNWKVQPGFCVEIKKGTAHQITNNSSDDLVIYEMQYGYCMEEDIERIEDKYERDFNAGGTNGR